MSCSHNSIVFFRASLLVCHQYLTGHMLVLLNRVNYYQEGSKVHSHLDVSTAFRKALTTWASWVDQNVNANKTHVFFRSSAPTHFRSVISLFFKKEIHLRIIKNNLLVVPIFCFQWWGMEFWRTLQREHQAPKL